MNILSLKVEPRCASRGGGGGEIRPPVFVMSMKC